jgi:hypothetical protein
LSVTTAAAFGQQAKVISREQVLADVDTLVYYITTVHPDPFTVISEQDFTARIGQLKASLPDSLTDRELYLRLSPIVASLGDGHTSLALQKSSLKKLGDGRYFPLELSVDPSTFEMTSAGRRVSQINGVAAEEIVRAVLETQSGESQSFRAARVTYSTNWPIFVSLLYPAEKYTVQFADGETVHLDGTTFDKAAALVPQTGGKPNYTYRIVAEKNAAVLEFNAFRDKESFSKLLDSMFTELKNKEINNLIIDLRGNGGGNGDMSDELFQYISPVPFNLFGEITLRLSEPLRRSYSFDFLPDEIPAELLQRDTIVRWSKIDELRSVFELRPLRDNPLRFAGKEKKVYVLTSPITFSSATSFTWAFQYFDMGTIVGEETGGYAVTFGDMMGMYLPHSRLIFGVSYKEFYGYGATEADRRPVQPDIAVPAEEALDYVLENLIE